MIRKIVYIILLAFAFINQAVALDHIDLATTACELHRSFPPSFSPNGQSVAWTVKERPQQDFFDPDKDSHPLVTSHLHRGSKICISPNPFEKPFEILTTGKNCFAPSWSPDGNSLAYISDADGMAQLWIFSLQERSSRKVSAIALRQNSTLVWSKEGKEIYALTLPVGLLETYNQIHSESISVFKYHGSKDNDPHLFVNAGADLHAINVDTGTFQRVLEANPSKTFFNWSRSPSGRWFCYQNLQPTKEVHGNLFELCIVSSDGQYLSQLASVALNWGYDGALYAWHPTQDQLFYVADSKLWQADVSENGVVSPLFPELGSYDSSVMAFTKNASGLVVGLEPVNTRDYSPLHAQTLAYIPLSKERPRLFSIPQEWIFSTLITNTNRIAWQPDENKIAFTACHRETKQETVMQLDFTTGQFDLLWTGNGLLKPTDFSPTHDKLLCIYEDFTHPSEVLVFDSRMEHVQLSHIEPRFDSLPLGTCHTFETSFSGTARELKKMQTTVILPLGAKLGDRLPAIVVHYPGSDCSSISRDFGGGDLIGGIPNWLLTSHGFAVILPDLILPEEAIGRPLECMTERLLAQLYRAADLGYIDLNRLGIMGQSYGGYGTAGIISHTDLFKAAVATNGIYDLASFSYHMDKTGLNFWLTWAELDQGRMGNTLFEAAQRYIENSPFYRADKIHTPLLLVHGCLDDAYPDATKLFSALRHLKRSVELVTYRDGWHIFNFMKQQDHQHAAKKILEFFHHHLDE